MFFQAVQRYPLSASEQVGKMSVELLRKPPPDYYKRMGPYVGLTLEGVEAIMLYEVDEGREGDAYKYLADLYATYRVVEGYSVVIVPLLSGSDALSILGLKV